MTHFRRTGAAGKLEEAPALLFDFGGTLDGEGVAWKTRFFRLWQQEAGQIEPQRFDRAFYDADDALVGTLPRKATLSETARLLARGLAKRLSPEKTALADRVADRFSSQAAARLSQSAVLLKRLASEYRLGVVSNFYGNLFAVCAEAGLTPHLSAVIDSAVVGFEKPDPRIFEAALATLGARASEALFVGDSLARDMAGARGVGMRHLLLASPSCDIATACCSEDRVILQLADLPAALTAMSFGNPDEIRESDRGHDLMERSPLT